jgi:hypothetical protein
LGFFSGFVVGPTAFGLLADAFGYGWAWQGVVLVFVGSAVVAPFIAGQAGPRPVTAS